jgi:hypothetical protein
MYWFGNGNPPSSIDTLGFTVTTQLGFRAGFQSGTRFVVNNKADRIGLRLTQQGPVIRLEASF